MNLLLNIMNNVIITLIIGFWLIFIAVFSIQNITLVSLQFLSFQSIQIPVGVLLSFFLAGGFLLGGITPLFFSKKKTQPPIKNNSQKRRKDATFKRDWEEEKDPLFDWE